MKIESFDGKTYAVLGHTFVDGFFINLDCLERHIAEARKLGANDIHMEGRAGGVKLRYVRLATKKDAIEAQVGYAKAALKRQQEYVKRLERDLAKENN